MTIRRDCHKIVDFFEWFAAPFHFVVDTVKILGATGNLDLDSVFAQFIFYGCFEFLDVVLALFALHGHLVGDFLVDFGFEVFEAQIFQFPANAGKTEAVGQRGVDLESLAGDSPLSARGDVLQGSHVVQTIGKFDQNDPDVPGHGQQHFAIGLCLARFPTFKGETIDFCNAVDQGCDLVAEFSFHFIRSSRRVLQDIVQKPRRYRGGVKSQLGKYAGYLDAVLQEKGSSGLAGLAAVVLVGGSDMPGI